ncbi:DNA mismatch repair [Colletotrichum plurivorum]|uniref:DNA mismatch repair n=1 Tax=Colletotrichum plurivorum TaxID=2175906 RepID=A0A8H6KME9_9PEZI|nr:DNA mismatch repair [Colletotrichum plurivorum]
MPIKQLPQCTIRQLGSSTAILSPVSLVKELVENSIDAEASSIEIIISPNVVDKIQVRDNGKGISPGDYDALGRRAHTSKLRTFEELQCRGGRTLGFRGDALASANTLSVLTITTRTDEDLVANQLTLNPSGGGLSTRKPVSAPVGTTIDATDLFSGFPETYDGTIRNGGTALERPDTPASGFLLEAFVPSADADPSMIERKGYFISVDSRPMSATRGTMKELVDIYKAYLRDCLAAKASQRGLKTPFIRLNIQCSPGSYDPNVVASKDEVLFANESILLRLFEEMCKKLYHPPEKQAHDVTRNGNPDQASSGDGRVDFVQDKDEEETMGAAVRERDLEDHRVDGIEFREPGAPNDHEQIATLPPGRTRLSCHSILAGIESQPAPAVFRSASAEGVNAEGEDAESAKEHDSDEASSQGIRGMDSVDSFLRQVEVTAPTRCLLRTTWEVDMTRSKTASPTGDSETVLLHPVSNHIAEFLSRQRAEQNQRNQPNPWSIAKKAAGRRGGEGLGDSINMEQHHDHMAAAPSSEPAHAPGAEGFTHQMPIGSMCETSEGQRSVEIVPSLVLQECTPQIDDGDGPNEIETGASRRPAGQNECFQETRHQGGSGTSRDEDQIRQFGEPHDPDDLPTDGVVRSSEFRNAHARRRWSFDQSGRDSLFGTPPPSSPLHKPFRVPARAGPVQTRRGRFSRTSREDATRRNVRQSGLTQSKLILDARKSLDPVIAHDAERVCNPSTYRELDEANGEFSMIEQTPCRHRNASPSPTERQMDVALERLNTLRPRAMGSRPGEDDQRLGNLEEGVEKRGRSMDRKLTAAFNMPAGTSERSRLASKSSRGSKTHKRTISGMLPLEMPGIETNLQFQLLQIDPSDIENQAKIISYYDTYITQGLQEPGFALEPAEADDVNSQLQEVVENWASKKYSVDLDLRINIAEILEKGDLSIIC